MGTDRVRSYLTALVLSHRMSYRPSQRSGIMLPNTLTDFEQQEKVMV